MMATSSLESVAPVSSLPETELRQAIPWLIKLRWLAIVGVSMVVGITAHLFHLVPHCLPLYLIVAGMAVCNVVYSLLLKTTVRPRLLVLSQIILDLVALTALLDSAGGIVNPFAFFFVFHVIIASILLPARESYAVASLACGLFISLTLGESLGVFPHQALSAPFWQLGGEVFSLPTLGILSAFVMVIFGAAYLTVTIATRLRHRETQVRYLLAYNQGLIDHLGEKICVIGPDYRIHFANDMVRSSLMGDTDQTCYAVLWGEDRPCQDCPLEQVIAMDKVITLTREDHESRVYEQVFSPLPSPQGTPMVIEKCRDVTQQVALQKELVLTEKLAVVGELAAGLAHDIGNPLDGCQHALGLVRRRVPPSVNVHAFLELMQQGLQRIDMIVRRFLVMARQDGFRMRPVEVPEIIDSALLFLEHRIAERAITVEKEWAPALPPLFADPDTLCQALTNVLLNAAEAIEGPGRIDIAARYTERDGRGWVEIRVTDSGCGIPSQDLERVFEPFFTTKPDGKGTGLGLAITRRFIRSHGGEITVCSTVGEGSTFIITLPVCEQYTEGNMERYG
jgi:signal transduction histidine kinase